MCAGTVSHHVKHMIIIYYYSSWALVVLYMMVRPLQEANWLVITFKYKLNGERFLELSCVCVGIPL